MLQRLLQRLRVGDELVHGDLGALVEAALHVLRAIGLVPVQLAYPQAAMALGLLVFSIALIDELVITFRTGKPSFVAAEDAIALGKEG